MGLFGEIQSFLGFVIPWPNKKKIYYSVCLFSTVSVLKLRLHIFGLSYGTVYGLVKAQKRVNNICKQYFAF